MNFLTLEVLGSDVWFSGGALHGQCFPSGDAIFVKGDSYWHQREIPPIEALEGGFWMLHRSISRGHPAIACSYFNKRTQLIEERYFKVLYRSGVYRFGPRFPKIIERSNWKLADRGERLKRAA